MTNKNKNKLIGITASIVFHAVVLVLLFVLCFRTPLPLPGEAGVEVNLGMYAEAMTQRSNEATRQRVNETTSQQEIEEVMEDEEVPAIEEVVEEKDEEIDEKPEENVEEKAEEVVEEKPVINQRAMFKAPSNKQDKPSSEGNAEGVGEQGNPNGLKDMERYEGHGGSGGGPAYDLGGRGAKSISSPSRDFNEEGKVVVDIWVDKEGRVQRAEIGKGSTIANSNMLESAKHAALNSIFNKDDKAVDLQKGTITYTFIIRQ